MPTFSTKNRYVEFFSKFSSKKPTPGTRGQFAESIYRSPHVAPYFRRKYQHVCRWIRSRRFDFPPRPPTPPFFRRYVKKNIAVSHVWRSGVIVAANTFAKERGPRRGYVEVRFIRNVHFGWLLIGDLERRTGIRGWTKEVEHEMEMSTEFERATFVLSSPCPLSLRFLRVILALTKFPPVVARSSRAGARKAQRPWSSPLRNFMVALEGKKPLLYEYLRVFWGKRCKHRVNIVKLRTFFCSRCYENKNRILLAKPFQNAVAIQRSEKLRAKKRRQTRGILISTLALALHKARDAIHFAPLIRSADINSGGEKREIVASLWKMLENWTFFEKFFFSLVFDEFSHSGKRNSFTGEEKKRWNRF